MTLIEYVITATDIENNKKFYITDLEALSVDTKVDYAVTFKSKTEAEDFASRLSSDKFDFGIEQVYKVIFDKKDLDKLETL